MIRHLKRAMMSKHKERQASAKDYLSTGSTLLNLACAGRVFGGFLAGHYYFLVGDSDSGKTFLSLTCMAEAAQNPNFESYRLIFDDAEDGALMDKTQFFGETASARLEPPGGTIDEPLFSTSAEDFYYHVDDAIKDGRPFIYVLDSQDALSSRQEGETFQKQKSAHRKQRKVPGSYGDAKAKIHSANLRRLVGGIKKSKSILIMIGQSRDSMDPFTRNNYSGGKALKFYATLQLWSSKKGMIRKEVVKDKKIQQGIISRVQVVKNRLMGRDRTVEIPIYHSFGIRDVESCIDYLLEWGHWKKERGQINAKELGIVGNKEELIKQIGMGPKRRTLRRVVGKVWKKIEAACALTDEKIYQ